MKVDKMDEHGRKWMNMDECELMLLKVDESICGATFISDAVIVVPEQLCHLLVISKNSDGINCCFVNHLHTYI